MPGDLHGAEIFEPSPNGPISAGHQLNITPASNATDKKFEFAINQNSSGVFQNAALQLPTSENNKQVYLSFPGHDSGDSSSSIVSLWNQNTNSGSGEFNNAFNILANGKDIKLTAEARNGSYSTWTFDSSGSLTLPTGGEIKSVAGTGDVVIHANNGTQRTWTFGAAGSITLPQGSVIGETNNTTVITPPTANPGQSLVIRPTASFYLSASGYIVPGENLIITLTNSNNASVDNTYINYTITDAVASQLGLSSLTGHFPYLSPSATNPQSASIVLPIPLNSSALTFTLTIDSDQPAGSANVTITVTSNGIFNNELSHVHLVAGNPSVVDLYLGDDDQYVKIEKNQGNVVIGTTNFSGSPTLYSSWTFSTDGTLSLPTSTGSITFPDLTVQTTAYRVMSLPPLTAWGTVVSFDNLSFSFDATTGSPGFNGGYGQGNGSYSTLIWTADLYQQQLASTPNSTISSGGPVQYFNYNGPNLITEVALTPGDSFVLRIQDVDTNRVYRATFLASFKAADVGNEGKYGAITVERLV